MASIFGISKLPVTTISSVLEQPTYIKSPQRPYLGQINKNMEVYLPNTKKISMKNQFRKWMSFIFKK